MKFIKTFLFLLILYALQGGYAVAGDIFEDFNDWVTGNGTQTNNGWVAVDGQISDRDNSIGSVGAIWLWQGTSYLKSPLLSNGVGKITFETASRYDTPIEFFVETSTNGVDPWVTQETLTNSAGNRVWGWWTNSIDLYESCYLRIKASSTKLGIDNFTIEPPPAKVSFSTPYTDPASPKVGQAVRVFCTITPNPFATDVTASLIYEIAGESATIAMSETATQNLYRATGLIPAQSLAGLTVNYEVKALFEGPSAYSPASTTSLYTVASAPFDSEYDTMDVIGYSTTNMTIISNSLWRGIINIGSSQTDPGFQFRGVSTNGTTTNTWGDINPNSTELIVHGTAALSETAFTIDSMPAGDYAFFFNETNKFYIVNSANFNNFDDWLGATSVGNHETNGWVVNDGWITDDAERRRGTQSCYLSTNGNSYVRSPELTNGIGQISFWLRHWETNAIPLTELNIQLSATGGTNINEWTTISTTNVYFSDFNRFVTPYINDYHYRYVRIQNTTDTPKAKLAIDEFMVTSADAGVTFSNLTHTPLNPSITNEVTIDVDIYPTNNVTDISAKLWYRIGTNGNFTSTDMTNTSGNHFQTDPPIPHTEPSTVQYYIEPEFTTPLGRNGIYTFYPAGGPNNPASYSNSDTNAASTYFEEYEGWTVMKKIDGVLSQTNNGWIVNDAEIFNADYSITPEKAEAAWLLNTEIEGFTNAFIQSPELKHGAGLLTFKTKNRRSTQADADLLVQILLEGSSNWDTVETITSDDHNWIEHTVHIHIESPIYIRIFKEEQTPSSTRIGVDDIEITYPIAKVKISNEDFHPLYPADSDRVEISCDIISDSIFAPAIDITARVYYKLSTETNYTAQPVEMTRSGSHYVTSPGIPTQDAGDTVDYYIESTFKGYNIITNNSPTYSPSDATNSYYSYHVRAHESSYGSLVMNTINGDVNMKQVSDENWIGILNYTTPTNDTPIIIQGNDYYDGTNLTEGTTEWGDDSQTRTNLPYVGQMTSGDINLILWGAVSGQYILDFNEITGEYVIRHGVYNDFNSWPSDPNYFEFSYGAPGVMVFAENFSNTNDWPLTVFGSLFEDFDSEHWVATDDYPPTNAFGSFTPGQIATYITTNQTLVIPQMIGQAIMIGDDGTNQDLNGSIQTHPGLPNNGTGNVEFDIRCVNDELAPALYDAFIYTNLIVEARIKATAVPKNSSEDSYGDTYVSVIGHYTDADNYYELRLVQYTDVKIRLEIWKNQAGAMRWIKNSTAWTGKITTAIKISLLIHINGSSNVELQAYADDIPKISTVTDSELPITDPGYIALSGMDADLSVEHVKIYTITANDYNTKTLAYEQYFTSDPPDADWTLGSWTVDTAVPGFALRDGFTASPITFAIEYSEDNITWDISKTYTGFKNSAYTNITHAVNRPEYTLIRVRKLSFDSGYLIVDNLIAYDWHATNFIQSSGWIVNEGCIDDDNSGGDINNKIQSLELHTSKAYTTEDQYIRSPLMSNGAAIIEFDYKTATTATNKLIFSIYYTEKGHEDQWPPELGITITNTITNTSFAPTDWTAFSWRLPNGNGTNDYSMYMKVQNQSTDWDSGMLIDNIRITEPIQYDDKAWRGYNTLITGNKINKLLFEHNNNTNINIKGAYLNNDNNIGTKNDNQNYTDDQPYIETSFITNGIGEVGFWYRAWDTTSSRIDIIGSKNDREMDEDSWHLLKTINNITNQNFQYFSNSFYEPDYKYLRLRVPSSIPNMGRVCIDNLMVAQPFGAIVYLRNMTLIPELPLVGDSVCIKAELYATFYNPSNILLSANFTTGTNNWGEYSSYTPIDMYPLETNGNVVTYQSTIPFKAGGHDIDTVVQYYVQADFEGFFSDKSSPTDLGFEESEFTNPEWYWPVDLNANQTNQTPYYVVFSCLPGQVWINELNIIDDSYESDNQYIELCGISNIDISNWKINSYNIDVNANVTTNALYSIPNSTQLPYDTTNDFGFYVLGKSSVAQIDQTLTNNLPDEGGLHLVRSMGAIEHSVCYDYDGGLNLGVTNNPNYRFVYIGTDDDWEDTALYATGSGSNLTDFTENFIFEPYAYSPGAINSGQTLVAWSTGTNGPLYDGSIAIDSFSITETNITFVITAETNGLTMTPWYTTNLITGPWNQGINKGQSGLETNYNVWCDLYTNAPGAFYKVTTE